MIKKAIAIFVAAVTSAATGIPLPPKPPIHHAPPAAWTVLPLGDSITLGVNGTNEGYRGPLRVLLPVLTFVGSQGTAPLLHEGHSGWRIDQLQAVPIGHPTFVILHAGTNDAVQNHTAAQMLADMVTLLAGIPVGVRVFVAQIPTSTWATPAQQAVEVAFDAGLPALASRWVTIVDLRLDPADLSDGVHPNDNGYTKMAQLLAAAFPEAMVS